MIVRQEASTKSVRLTAVKLGKILPIVKRGSAFYQVEYEVGKNGWIATTFTRDFDADKRDSVYREIGDKQLKTQKVDYANASEVTEFLRTAQALVKTDEARADLRFKRLRYIAAALKAIPSGKGGQFPYKNFIKANEKDIVYSEPSAEWYVRAESLWDLREKFAALPIAEEIAWTAAATTIPGECEGYINCYLYNIRATDGEYLAAKAAAGQDKAEKQRKSDHDPDRDEHPAQLAPSQPGKVRHPHRDQPAVGDHDGDALEPARRVPGLVAVIHAD